MNLVFYGANEVLEAYWEYFDPQVKIISIIDSDEKIYGKKYMGINVLPVEDIRRLHYDYVIIGILTTVEEIKMQLIDLGVPENKIIEIRKADRFISETAKKEFESLLKQILRKPLKHRVNICSSLNLYNNIPDKLANDYFVGNNCTLQKKGYFNIRVSDGALTKLFGTREIIIWNGLSYDDLMVVQNMPYDVFRIGSLKQSIDSIIWKGDFNSRFPCAVWDLNKDILNITKLPAMPPDEDEITQVKNILYIPGKRFKKEDCFTETSYNYLAETLAQICDKNDAFRALNVTLSVYTPGYKFGEDLSNIRFIAGAVEDIYKLANDADLLITDYSVSNAHLLVLGKPLLFFMPENEDYFMPKSFYVNGLSVKNLVHSIEALTDIFEVLPDVLDKRLKSIEELAWDKNDNICALIWSSIDWQAKQFG